MTNSKKNDLNYAKFTDSDDEWGSFRLPLKAELKPSRKKESLDSRIDKLRDRLKQK